MNTAALAIYIFGAVITVIAALVTLEDNYRYTREKARIALLFWAWPIIVIYYTVRFIIELWDLAGWGPR